MLELLVCNLDFTGSLEADAGAANRADLDWDPETALAPSDVLSLLLGEGMSMVLLPSFPAVPGLSLEAESGGRKFAAGT